MFFEIRQYRIKDGQMDAWVRLMEEEIIPFQMSKGMVVFGSFTGKDEDDLYVWIRRFEDEAERDRLYEAVYQSDHWKNVITPKVDGLLDRARIVVTRVEPTSRSVMH
jgi:quinol monooxygenase YgiN